MKQLEEAMRSATDLTIESDQKRKPSWYKAAESKLAPAVTARNEATKAYRSIPTPERKIRLQRTRAQVKKLVKEAQNEWYRERFTKMNAHNDKKTHAPHNLKDIWNAIVEIRAGMPVTRQIQPMILKNKDTGKLGKTPEENAKIMEKNLNTIFNKKGTYDASAVDDVRQRDPMPWKWLDAMPTFEEFVKTVKKLGDNKSGGDAKCYAEYYKALLTTDDASSLMMDILAEFWTSGSYPGDTNIPDIPADFMQSSRPDNDQAGSARAPDRNSNQLHLLLHSHPTRRETRTRNFIQPDCTPRQQPHRTHVQQVQTCTHGAGRSTAGCLQRMAR